MLYIVNFSTGLASFEAARRTLEKHGPQNTLVVFCDVRGDPSRDPHAAPLGTNWDGEDDDNYRFLADAERLFGVSIQRLQHPEGLGVWGTIFKHRKIVIPNHAQIVPCSKALKMDTMDAFVQSLGEPVTQVLGWGWMEDDRVAKFRARVDTDVWFPMTEKPYVNNCHIAAWLRERGVEPPRAYSQGYVHANCGGACIKAGQQQWAALLGHNRGRYLYNEAQEELFRAQINSNVSILRDRRGGVTQPLPLSQFRQEIESGGRTPTPFDWGGCGCFAPSPQMRMDDLLLETRRYQQENSRQGAKPQ